MTKGKKFGMYLFLCIVSFISVFPLYWMVCAATNTSAEVVSGRLIPGTYFIENFKNLMANQNIGRALGNSFKYSIILTLISLVVSSLAGYGFEIYHDKAKDTVMSIILLAMMVPFVATLIPLFQMISTAGWLNTTIGFILPTVSTPFLIMMFRQSARAFPHDIMEAARIDGSKEFRTFNQIVLPIMKPAIAVQAIFTFVGSWNNYFVPALVIQSKDKMTVPILIAMLRGADYMNFDMGKIYMMIMVAIVPIILVYLLLSKYIIAGVTLGGVKG